jgi:hypothetical protein
VDQVAGDFDTAALFKVVDEQLAARDMTVSQLVKQLAWTSKPAFLRMRESGPFAGCQFILPVIQWVGRTPESFMTGGADFPGELLPDPGSGRWRWYWDMPDLASALDVRRAERELTWAQVAEEFGSSSAEIKALQKTKYGMSIGFSMRAARWLDRTAASFMWEHDGLGLPWSGRRVDARPK